MDDPPVFGGDGFKRARGRGPDADDAPAGVLGCCAALASISNGSGAIRCSSTTSVRTGSKVP